jgi:hypothetical protein
MMMHLRADVNPFDYVFQDIPDFSRAVFKVSALRGQSWRPIERKWDDYDPEQAPVPNPRWYIFKKLPDLEEEDE